MQKNKELSVVITGASSGIGKATALECARHGARIALMARRKEALEELAHECERAGGKALVLPCDVTNEKQVRTLAAKAHRKFGEIDVWVNNAAVAIFGPFEEIPYEDFRRVIDVNLFGYIHGARSILPFFREQGYGILINVSSIVGVTGQPYTSPYTISKFAIRGLSENLQQEYVNEKNIHICTVLPGTVDTPLFQNAANYMRRAVDTPPPVYDAQNVAEVIWNLTQKPRKEVFVGMAPRIQAALVHSAHNRMSDRMVQQVAYTKHFKDEPAEPSHGNLFHPGKEAAAISGGWKPQNGNPASKAALPLGGTLLLGGLGTAAILLSRQRQGKPLIKSKRH